MSEIILEMKNIIKTFPGVKALDNVNLKLKKGEQDEFWKKVRKNQKRFRLYSRF